MFTTSTTSTTTTPTPTTNRRPQGALVAYWLGRSAQQYVDAYRPRTRIT